MADEREDAAAGRTPLGAEGVEGDDDTVRKRIMSGLAKRLQNPRQLSGDAAEVLGAVLETSDRAKTEMVKMVAREVRSYLQELHLAEAVNKLMTGHSLEVQMSLRLKPLSEPSGATASTATVTTAPVPSPPADAPASAAPVSKEGDTPAS